MGESGRKLQGQCTPMQGTQRQQRCVKSLKQAMKNGDSDKEVNSLQDLGDVNLDKGKVRRHGWDFTRASALYNAALVRCKESQVRETLIHRIKYTEKLFLKRVAKVNKHDAAMYDYQIDLNHKAELTRIRDMCRERLVSIATMCDYSKNPMEDVAARVRERGRAEAVRELYRDIMREMKGFITSLVEECFTVLGRPPCKYALIGMGSFARQEMTPYSDLEFAILVEEGQGTEEIKTYFRILTHLLHLKVLNLGETILPSMAIPYLNDFGNQEHNWLYDSVTPRGFSFDGAMPWASKTPLGRGETKKKAALELIMTPREMAELQTGERSVKEGYHLANVLSKVDLIMGDNDILAIYDELVSQKLDEDFFNSGHYTVGQGRAMLSILLMKNFDLNKTAPTSGELYDVKQVVYRFLSMCFQHIGYLCGTAGKTLTDITEELQKGGLLTSLGAHNVRVAAAIAHEIRLRTYCTYGKQREHMAIAKPLHTRPAMVETQTNRNTPESTCMKTKRGAKQHKDVAISTTDASLSPYHVYHIDDSNLLHRFYMTVLPLQSLLWDKGQSSDVRQVFASHSLYGGAWERGKAFKILQQYARAEECLRNALQEDPKNNNLVLELGEVLKKLEKYHDLQQLLNPFLDKMEQSIVDDTGSNSNAAAKDLRLKKVQCYRKMLESTFPDNDKNGDVRQWLHSEALSQINAAGMSKLDQAQAYSKIANELAEYENREQSELYLLRALENLHSEPNPGDKTLHKLKRADALANIASTYRWLVAPPAQVIKYAQLAREAYIECIGADTPHFSFMSCMILLGEANRKLGNWKIAIEWFEQVIEMASALGEGRRNTVSVMLSLSKMGNCYRNLGELEKALELLQKAESFFPDTNAWEDLYTHVALDTLEDYGSVLETVGRVAEAQEQFRRILDLPGSGGAYEVMAKGKSSRRLGFMFHQSGQLNVAIEYLMQSYSLYAQVSNNDHGNVEAQVKLDALKAAMLTIYNKGMIELKLRKLGAAVQSFSATLELLDSTDIDIRRAFPTESEWSTRFALLALMYKGFCLFLTPDLQRATPVYAEAVDTFRDFFGPGSHHPVLAFFLTAKGRLHHTQGDSETAKKCYSEVWEMITRGQAEGQSGYESAMSALFSFSATMHEPNSPSGIAVTYYHLQKIMEQHTSFFFEQKGET